MKRMFSEIKLLLKALKGTTWGPLGSTMAEIEKRYREDAYRDYVLSMGPTEALRIDQEAIDSIMGKLPEVEEVASPED